MNNDRKNRIGKMIKQYREDNDLTQRDLAAQLGYTYGNFVGMLESGTSSFPIAGGKWLKYAQTMGKDPTEFLLLALCDVYPDMEPYLMPLLKNLKTEK